MKFIPYREGKAVCKSGKGNCRFQCQSLIGKVKHSIVIVACCVDLLVSIPHRKGKATAFTPFVTAIIPQTHHFYNVFLKKVGRSPFFKVWFLPILSHFSKIVIWVLRSTDFLYHTIPPSFQSPLFLPEIKIISFDSALIVQ